MQFIEILNGLEITWSRSLFAVVGFVLVVIVIAATAGSVIAAITKPESFGILNATSPSNH